jgi:hypothetical protein
MLVVGQEQGKRYCESRLKVVSLRHFDNTKIPHWTNTKSIEERAMAEEGAVPYWILLAQQKSCASRISGATASLAYLSI